MSLREILQTDMKQAMKDRENGKLRLAVLRMVWGLPFGTKKLTKRQN